MMKKRRKRKRERDDTKEEEDLEQRLYNAASVGRQNIVDARRADQSNQSNQSVSV